MRKATRAQWIKFGIITLLYLIFLVWVKSWWGLVIVPFIFDIYISKKIPWGFWKKSKNPAVRGIMSWVDAIVFALVAVYFVNIYIFQNYQIPSNPYLIFSPAYLRLPHTTNITYAQSSIFQPFYPFVDCFLRRNIIKITPLQPLHFR